MARISLKAGTSSLNSPLNHLLGSPCAGDPSFFQQRDRQSALQDCNGPDLPSLQPVMRMLVSMVGQVKEKPRPSQPGQTRRTAGVSQSRSPSAEMPQYRVCHMPRMVSQPAQCAHGYVSQLQGELTRGQIEFHGGLFFPKFSSGTCHLRVQWNSPWVPRRTKRHSTASTETQQVPGPASATGWLRSLGLRSRL